MSSPLPKGLEAELAYAPSAAAPWAAAFFSSSSSFSRATDLIGMILGLLKTSDRFPFSE
jgi:hypothetical protein